MKTVVIKNDDLSYAAEVILRGGLVAVPTDTIYGLAGNGLDAGAVAKIYEVKGRPAVKPLILLVKDISAAEAVCAWIPESARILANAFWPGPLTLVLPRGDTVPDITAAGGSTIGVRCPNHPKTLELLRLTGIPLAAPSANTSDMPSPKNAGEVLAYFDGKIDCVIDGGVSELGFESTIVDLTEEPFRILRQGALPEAEIRRALYIYL
jgi:L-threonylcarbamoyladenylate synthase